MPRPLRDPPIIDPPIRLAVCVSGAGTMLQKGAVDQIEGYQSRFQTIQGLDERLFKGLLVSEFASKDAFDTLYRKRTKNAG